MAVTMNEVPTHERPRERLLARGASALSEAELLTILLRSGTPGLSATDLATALLAEYGGLGGLASARPEELASSAGVGLAKATSIVAAFELCRRLPAQEHRPILRSAQDVASVAMRDLDGLRRERVLVLVCDSRNRVRQTIMVAEGSVDRSHAPIREVLNAVLRHDGRAFAVAHNHPGGTSRPSAADMATTEKLRAAAAAVGLRFLCHVVLGVGDWAEA